jgi:hypothetical protein
MSAHLLPKLIMGALVEEVEIVFGPKGVGLQVLFHGIPRIAYSERKDEGRSRGRNKRPRKPAVPPRRVAFPSFAFSTNLEVEL